jgi:hypothetical protein
MGPKVQLQVITFVFIKILSLNTMTNTLLIACLTVCSLISTEMSVPPNTCMSMEFFARGMTMWMRLMQE